MSAGFLAPTVIFTFTITTVSYRSRYRGSSIMPDVWCLGSGMDDARYFIVRLGLDGRQAPELVECCQLRGFMISCP
jgi:hypothetical protein